MQYYTIKAIQIYIVLFLAENFRVSEIVMNLMLTNLLLQQVSALLRLYRPLITYQKTDTFNSSIFYFNLFVCLFVIKS